MTVRRIAALNYFVETVQGFQMQGHSTGREKARGLAVSEQRGYAAAAKRKIPARAMDFAIYDLCGDWCSQVCMSKRRKRRVPGTQDHSFASIPGIELQGP